MTAECWLLITYYYHAVSQRHLADRTNVTRRTSSPVRSHLDKVAIGLMTNVNETFTIAGLKTGVTRYRVLSTHYTA